MTQNISFLGEDDFLSVMNDENRKWRDSCVTRGTLESFDLTRLSYYVAEPAKPTASIVIVHGMGEFFGKYHEYAWYLYQAGFKVFFLEQRGFGYSEGKMDEPDLIYIDDYDTYVEDLRIFIDKVVMPKSENLGLILLAHSMGGAIGTLFLEKYPNYFKAAILSSPMIKMKSANMSPVLVKLLGIYSFVFGKKKSLAPNQKHFDPNTPFEISSAKSRPRFDYQLNMRRNNEHYQTTGATFGWALASFKIHDRIIKHLSNIKIPVSVMTAGDDHLIDPEGYKEFTEKVPQAKVYHYPTSRHEIFNSDEDNRKKYFEDILDILGEYIKT